MKYDDDKVSSVKEGVTEETDAYILFYHRRESTTGCGPQILEASCTTSEDKSMTGMFEENLVTSEDKRKHDSTVEDLKNTNIPSLHLPDCGTENGETLLEDILD